MTQGSIEPEDVETDRVLREIGSSGFEELEVEKMVKLSRVRLFFC
jgi:hypothetical protein